MKKAIIVNLLLLAVVSMNAQTIEEIVRKNYELSAMEAYKNATTVQITAKAYQGGMEIPMIISVKNPDKVRIEMSIQGMSIIQSFDGVTGYMINPMMGSNDAIELPPSDAAKLKNQVSFATDMTEYLKNNKIEMAGESTVDGKPVWNIKVEMPDGEIVTLFIDKASYLQVKTEMSVNQMGVDMSVETYMSDYTDFNGIKLPKTTTTYADGTEMVMMMIEKVEINSPMDDKMFKLK
jgi:outer membrane lipoprotein-sorting protein